MFFDASNDFLQYIQVHSVGDDLECIFADALDGRGDSYARNRGVAERLISDARNASVGGNNARLASEQEHFRSRIDKAVARAVEVRIVFVHAYACECGAAAAQIGRNHGWK